MLSSQKRGVHPNPLEPPLRTGLYLKEFYIKLPQLYGMVCTMYIIIDRVVVKLECTKCTHGRIPALIYNVAPKPPPCT